jgi:hypothetical protein
MTEDGLVVREEGDELDDNDNEDDDVLIVLLPPPPPAPLLLSFPMSLSCGKLLSSSSSPAPCSLPVTLPSRSTISLMVILLGAVSCPNPLGKLPSAAMNSTSSSNNGNDSEIFRKFIDILHTVVLTRKALENINYYAGYL